MIRRFVNIFRKKAIQQTAFVYAGSLFNAASLFGFNMLLARSLDKYHYGLFSLSVLVLMTITELSDFGLNAGVLRFAPYYISQKEDSKLVQLLRMVWRWRVMLVLLLTGGTVLLSPFIGKFILGDAAVTPFVAYTALGVGGVVFLGFASTVLQAQQRFYSYSIFQCLKGLLRLLAVLVMYYAGVRTLFAYLTAYIAVPWLLFLFAAYALPRGIFGFYRMEKYDEAIRSQVASFSFWITLSTLLGLLVSRIDHVMVSHMLGVAHVAVFTVAWQFIQFFPLVYNAITSVLMPKFSAVPDSSALRAILWRTLRFVGVGTLVALLYIYPSQYLIVFLFGEQYASAMPVYMVLAVGYALNILIVPFSLVISVFRETKLFVVTGFVQLIVTIFGNIIFIPRLGMMGVAYTFLCAMMVQVCVMVGIALYLLKKKNLVVV